MNPRTNLPVLFSFLILVLSLEVTAPAQVGISVIPGDASVIAGGQLQFQAEVWGLDDAHLHWAVYGRHKGADHVGTIDQNGLYQAPAHQCSGDIKVVATVLGTFGEPLGRDIVEVTVIDRARHPGSSHLHMTVDPWRATVAPGGLIRFWARVDGVRKPLIVWSVHGPGDDPRRWGVIEKGVYHAPLESPNGPIIVVAELLGPHREPVASAHCRVRVRPEPEERAAVQLQLTPSVATVFCGHRIQLRVSVSGLERPRFRWTLHGSDPRDHLGSISENGIYKAPRRPPAGPVRAVVSVLGEWGQQLGSASTLLHVKPRPVAPPPARVNVSIVPDPLRVYAGRSVRLRADVSGVPNARVVWRVYGSRRTGGRTGKINENGVYTAPAVLPKGRVVVVATVMGPWGEPVATGRAAVEVLEMPREPVTVRLMPNPVRVRYGETVRLRADVRGSRRGRVNWSVDASRCKGNPGAIDQNGVYRAPMRPPRGQVSIVARVMGRRGRPLATATSPIRFRGRPAGERPPRPGPGQGPEPRPKPTPKPIPQPRPTPKPKPVPATPGSDFGDAPDNSRGPAPAYPGVPGRFPTFKVTRNGTWPGASATQPGLEMLGSAVSREHDANASDADDMQMQLHRDDKGRFQLTINVTVAANAPDIPRYINILMDLNRDGQWKQTFVPSRTRGRGVLVEWIVKNSKVRVVPGTSATIKTAHFTLPQSVLDAHKQKPLGPWTRVLLSRTPMKRKHWDGSGLWPHGEVEDLRFGGVNGSPFAAYGGASPRVPDRGGRDRSGRDRGDRDRSGRDGRGR